MSKKLPSFIYFGTDFRWISNSVNYSKKYDDMCEAYCFEINRPQG